MYYIGINEQNPNELTHYCRNCGYIDNSNIKENSCILRNDIKKGERKFDHIINKYTKLDPTLPRINTVKCPNVKCATNNNEGKDDDIKHEVIYLRYDDIKLKYIYLCPTCDHIWKT